MSESEFSYLSKKIKNADFSSTPFQHITIPNFLSSEHFESTINSKQVRFAPHKSIKDLIETLLQSGYTTQEFPGCITDISTYVNFIEGRAKFDKQKVLGYGRDVIEGYGLTLRLKQYSDPFLSNLVAYLNGEEFQSTLKEKFGINEYVDVETAIQKNLSCYEISPHCDTSKKALTYMVNIYTEADCENISIHTHLLKFKDKYRYIYDLWKYNRNIDPVWVPWDWCDTIMKTSRNNSVTIFKPDFDTLHAVKLDYNHLAFQRNQIYGNLWYKASKAEKSLGWKDLDLLTPKEDLLPFGESISHGLKHIAKATRKKLLD